MQLDDARQLAETLMESHGLRGWAFRFDNARTRVGVCRFESRIIGLSRHYVRPNPIEEVTETILHEIAHALAGLDAGHGPRWKRIARQLGCSTDRCTRAPIDIEPRYSLWCDTCGKRLRHYHRMPRRDFESGRYKHASCGGTSFSVLPYESVEVLGS